jgi:hypothetical protein
MLIDYARAHSPDIVAQIKIIEEFSLVFIDLWFGIYLGLPSEMYNVVS